MSKFTHLHVHTQYSILDGLARISELIDKAYKDGQRAMAITDHGNLFGIFDFVEAVDSYNRKYADKDDPFKAILGCEVYVASRSRFDKDKNVREDRSGRHLILLAKNWTGYRNLCRLVSYSYSEGFYYTPRVDKELLRQYSEGLIACSACLGGELPQTIMKYNHFNSTNPILAAYELEQADKVVEEYKEIFGNDYYIELQLNGHREQLMVNDALKQLAQKHGVRCIATNDVHYVNRDDFEAHKMLICINTRKNFYSNEGNVQDEDTDNGFAYSGEEYLKTTAEMEALFVDFPEAILNTQHIANKIENYKITTPPSLPEFKVPDTFSSEYEYLEHLTYEGAKQRWSEVTDDIRERLELELSTIQKMGFPGYFLIVHDFINEGKKQGIRFGPGRGSASGSAISYCLGITNIDPIKYNLLFERFLNADRVTLPDMDIDIEDSGRDKVILYVIEKYGMDHVAQIVTFNTMAARGAIRDCARVLELPLPESNRLAKLVPESPKMTLEIAFNTVPELKKELQSSNEKIKKTLEFAQKLEGNIRSIGVHPCGVIIGKKSLYDLIPLCTTKKSDTLVTQFEGTQVEKAGLLKMDFLGLKTLNIITETLLNIQKRHGIAIDIDTVPLDDSRTYELFGSGDTTAIFQFESPGMRKSLQELKPERFEDIIAMISLYRPGPMDNIPTFINRKYGKEKITYPIEGMDVYLGETYGITVYQEQVMLLAQYIANFSPTQADTLRQAMGKKMENIMNDLEEAFLQGGMKNGHPKGILEELWKEWKRFSEYAFNKSHGTCYSYIAYQTAYLKTHYRAEFMAANLTNNLDNLDKITFLIDDVSHARIKVIGPDINESELNFTVNKSGNIRFGLGALKGVGSAAAISIIEEREENGPFENVFDFVERINLRNCNKRTIEAMAYAGAFDSFPNMHRAQFFHETKDGKNFIDRLITYGNSKQESATQNQISIFDATPEISGDALPDLPECEPWHSLQQLKYEKEIAGFYISGHPLDEAKPIINNYTNTHLGQLTNVSNFQSLLNRTLSFVGVVTEFQVKTDRYGKSYGDTTLEYYGDTYNLRLFGETFARYKHLFEEGSQLFIKAQFAEKYSDKNYDEKKYDLKFTDVFYLSEAYNKLCKKVILTLNVDNVSSNIAYLLEEIIEKSGGKTPLIIRIITLDENFHLDFNNYKTTVDPQKFLENFSLHVDYQIKLE